MEPFHQGPDIRAQFNDAQVFFEVKRRRPNKDDSLLLKTAGPFLYEKPETVNDIISVKLRQLREDESNVLVIWSDTISEVG